MQADDILMTAQSLEEDDLSVSPLSIGSIVKGIENLFDGEQSFGAFVLSLVYDPVGPFPQFLQDIVFAKDVGFEFFSHRQIIVINKDSQLQLQLMKKKHAINNPQYSDLNPFKAKEKHFKAYLHRQTDFSPLQASLTSAKQLNFQHMEIFVFDFPQGLILIKGLLNKKQQLQIGRECIFDYASNYRGNIIPEQPEKNKKYSYFDRRLRWVNLGQQYDWTHRLYMPETTEIPVTIRQIVDKAKNILQTMQLAPKADYRSQAVIVNYYKQSDYMTGHLDDAEIDQESPIYSFSLGLSCVFLIGGKTKEEQPLALRLDSGDCVVMGGASRKSWHGVPRVISDSVIWKDEFESEQMQQTFEYLSQNRININVRQVAN